MSLKTSLSLDDTGDLDNFVQRTARHMRKRRTSIAALPSLSTVKEESDGEREAQSKERSRSKSWSLASDFREEIGASAYEKLVNIYSDECHRTENKEGNDSFMANELTLGRVDSLRNCSRRYSMDRYQLNKSLAMGVSFEDYQNVRNAVSTYQLSYTTGDGKEVVVPDNDEAGYESSCSICSSRRNSVEDLLDESDSSSVGINQSDSSTIGINQLKSCTAGVGPEGKLENEGRGLLCELQTRIETHSRLTRRRASCTDFDTLLKARSKFAVNEMRIDLLPKSSVVPTVIISGNGTAPDSSQVLSLQSTIGRSSDSAMTLQPTTCIQTKGEGDGMNTSLSPKGPKNKLLDKIFNCHKLTTRRRSLNDILTGKDLKEQANNKLEELKKKFQKEEMLNPSKTLPKLYNDHKKLKEESSKPQNDPSESDQKLELHWDKIFSSLICEQRRKSFGDVKVRNAELVNDTSEKDVLGQTRDTLMNNKIIQSNTNAKLFEENTAAEAHTTKLNTPFVAKEQESVLNKREYPHNNLLDNVREAFHRTEGKRRNSIATTKPRSSLLEISVNNHENSIGSRVLPHRDTNVGKNSLTFETKLSRKDVKKPTPITGQTTFSQKPNVLKTVEKSHKTNQVLKPERPINFAGSSKLESENVSKEMLNATPTDQDSVVASSKSNELSNTVLVPKNTPASKRSPQKVPSNADNNPSSQSSVLQACLSDTSFGLEDNVKSKNSVLQEISNAKPPVSSNIVLSNGCTPLDSRTAAVSSKVPEMLNDSASASTRSLNTVQVVYRSPRTYSFTSSTATSNVLNNHKAQQESTVKPAIDNQSKPRNHELKATECLDSSVARQPLPTEQRFAALSEKYATLMANFTKDAKPRNKEVGLSSDRIVLKSHQEEGKSKTKTEKPVKDVKVSDITGVLELLQNETADRSKGSKTNDFGGNDSFIKEERFSNIALEEPEKNELEDISSTLQLLLRNTTPKTEVEEPRKKVEEGVTSSTLFIQKNMQPKVEEPKKKVEEGVKSLSLLIQESKPHKVEESRKGTTSMLHLLQGETKSETITEKSTVKNVEDNDIERLLELLQRKPSSKVESEEPNNIEKEENDIPNKLQTNQGSLNGKNKIEEQIEMESCSTTTVAQFLQTDFDSLNRDRHDEVLRQFDSESHTVSQTAKQSTPTLDLRICNTANVGHDRNTEQSYHNTNCKVPEEQLKKTQDAFQRLGGSTPKRTTVAAKLIGRKLKHGSSTGMRRTLAGRRSRVYGTIGLPTVPTTSLEYEAARNIIEKTKLNTSLKSEAVTVRELLKGLDSHLTEGELLAVCRECTKTLRTLDALGSLPAYLSLDTVILNPSGTVKFKHMSTGLTVDELYLATEYDKRIVTEKTCVFSLAVTLWSAADWRLTDAQKPNLSSKFQQLLISMTEDAPDDRPCLDHVLQACETSVPALMSSREQCQSLLWEYQAGLALDGQKIINKEADDAEKKVKSQRDALIGSLSVAASVKGFLKQTLGPKENKQSDSVTEPRLDGLKEYLEAKPSFHMKKTTASCSFDQNENINLSPRSTDEPTVKKSSGLTEEEKDRLLSLLLAESAKSVPSKPPSPVNLTHSHMMFSPINPASGASTPAFVPVPYPVPAMAPQPTASIWYMGPNTPVAYAPQSMFPPQYRDPVSPSFSSTHSYSFDNNCETTEMEFKSRRRVNSSPSSGSKNHGVGKKKEGKTRRTSAPANSKTSRIPRPVWNASPVYSRMRTNTFPAFNSQDIHSDFLSQETHSEISDEGFTEDVRARRGSYSSRASSAGSSRPASPFQQSSTMGDSRCSTPVGHSRRSSNSREGTPSLNQGSKSRPASPGSGSRSSSPVASLISKFEDLSQPQPDGGHQESKSTAVSSMISKFGSKSLLKEDRLSKKQFRPANNPGVHPAAVRPGPVRPASVQESYRNNRSNRNSGFGGQTGALSRTWPAEPWDFRSSDENLTSSRLYEDSSFLSTSGASSPSRYEHNTAARQSYTEGVALSPENHRRLHSSLDNLYSREARANSRVNFNYNDSLNSNPGTPLTNRRKWSSLESIPVNKADSIGYGRLHNSLWDRNRPSSLENLSSTSSRTDNEGQSSQKMLRSKGLSSSLGNISRSYRDRQDFEEIPPIPRRRVNSSAGLPISNFFSEASRSMEFGESYSDNVRYSDNSRYSTEYMNYTGTSPPVRESATRHQTHRSEPSGLSEFSTKTSYDNLFKTVSKQTRSDVQQNSVVESSITQPSYMFERPEKENSYHNGRLPSSGFSMFEYYTKKFETPTNNATGGLEGSSGAMDVGSNSSPNKIRTSSDVFAEMGFGRENIMPAERDLDSVTERRSNSRGYVAHLPVQPLNEAMQSVAVSGNNAGKSQGYLQRFEKRILRPGSDSDSELSPSNPKASHKAPTKNPNNSTSSAKSSHKRNPDSGPKMFGSKCGSRPMSPRARSPASYPKEPNSIQEKSANSRTATAKTKSRPPNLKLQPESSVNPTQRPDGRLISPTESSGNPTQRHDGRFTSPIESSGNPTQRHDGRFTSPTESSENPTQRHDGRFTSPIESSGNPTQRHDGRFTSPTESSGNPTQRHDGRFTSPTQSSGNADQRPDGKFTFPTARNTNMFAAGMDARPEAEGKNLESRAVEPRHGDNPRKSRRGSDSEQKPVGSRHHHAEKHSSSGSRNANRRVDHTHGSHHSEQKAHKSTTMSSVYNRRQSTPNVPSSKQPVKLPVKKTFSNPNTSDVNADGVAMPYCSGSAGNSSSARFFYNESEKTSPRPNNVHLHQGRRKPDTQDAPDSTYIATDVLKANSDNFGNTPLPKDNRASQRNLADSNSNLTSKGSGQKEHSEERRTKTRLGSDSGPIKSHKSSTPVLQSRRQSTPAVYSRKQTENPPGGKSASTPTSPNVKSPSAEVFPDNYTTQKHSAATVMHSGVSSKQVPRSPGSPNLVRFFDRVKTASIKGRSGSPAPASPKPILKSTTNFPIPASPARAQHFDFSFKDKTSPERTNSPSIKANSPNLPAGTNSETSASQGKNIKRNSVISSPEGIDLVAEPRVFSPRKGKFPTQNKFFYEPVKEPAVAFSATPTSSPTTTPVGTPVHIPTRTPIGDPVLISRNVITEDSRQHVQTESVKTDTHVNTVEQPSKIFGVSSGLKSSTERTSVPAAAHVFKPNVKPSIEGHKEDLAAKFSEIEGPGIRKITSKSLSNIFQESSDKNEENSHVGIAKKRISYNTTTKKKDKESSRTSRPDSTADENTRTRPPSPGRIDSKELLGHLVKKVLTSAAAKQTISPPSLFTVENTSTVGEKNRQKFAGSLDSKSAGVIPSKDERQPSGISSTPRGKSVSPSQSAMREATLPSDSFNEPRFSDKGHSGDVLPIVRVETVRESSQPTLESSAEMGVSPEATRESNMLSTLVEMIHEEFAFDGYLDDGVEDVNMAEYVMSMSGMEEQMFKEAIVDQYSDLYWDEDLLHEMYRVVTPGAFPHRTSLQFTESTASDASRPGSVIPLDSSASDLRDLIGTSVSRSSSGRSAGETRDIVMSTLGEPTEFLPIKMIAPEILRDVQEELLPICEEYQKVMGGRLGTTMEDLADKIGTKIMGIGQQLTLERRAKRKSVTSFNKLADVDSKKDTVRDLASKLVREIEESDKKIMYLKTVLRRLRCVYAERFGLDTTLLYSFASKFGKESQTLEPQRNNSFLSFSPLWDQRSADECQMLTESTRGPSLQYGTREGLFSYLFSRHAMSQAYVRYFLYTFRYCATSDELFSFIRDKCSSSLRSHSEEKTLNHQLQIRYRALDLLAEWVDGYYTYDFKDNADLIKQLLFFLRDELVVVDKSERGLHLIELISDRQKLDSSGNSEEMSDSVSLLQLDLSKDILPTSKGKEFPRKHDSKKTKSSMQCFKRGSPAMTSSYKPSLVLKALSVTDHSSRTIAEQLTLIQQELFTSIHPIHFLNSRALGVGVGRNSPNKIAQKDSMFGFSTGMRRSSTIQSLATESSNSQLTGTDNLYATSPKSDGCLEALLEHAQDVIMWIAVEICSAPSVKIQLAFITKFVSIAKYCYEIRNFAVCVQILDALEMFVIRQLPVWKQVPNKVTEPLEELKAIKVLLKTDSTWLLKGEAWREKPTIPCTLLFLMHIQQLELGGFMLANGMYKWAKMRSIARLADQIRLFKQMRYAFELNPDLKARIKQRMAECRNEDLHHLAAENSANFHSLSGSHNSRKFQNAFRKMKATFGHS